MKKNRRTYFACLVCILLLTAPCSAQSTFLNHYASSSNEGGNSIVRKSVRAEAIGFQLVIGGFKQDSSMLMEVDDSGNQISQHCFKALQGHSEQIVNMFLDRDGFLVGVGESIGTYKTFAFKYDLNLHQLLWLKPSDVDGNFFHIIEVPGQSDYYLGGTNKNNFSPGLGFFSEGDS